MNLELFLVRVLTKRPMTYDPIVWGFEFFSSGAPAVFFREDGMLEMVPLLVCLFCCRLPLLPSVRGLEFLLFDGGAWTLLQSQSSPGSLGLCALCGAGLLAPAV
jgi:hypothetical protein